MFDAERFTSGDRDYVRAVIREHEAMVQLICQSYSVDYDNAQDLAQETWRIVWTRAGSFEGRGSFRGWLAKIAINVCLSDVRARKKTAARLRRYGRELRSLAGWTQVDPLAETERRELQRAIYRALPELSDGEFDAVTLRILEGRSPTETADIMGVTPATVRSHIRHAIKRLRTLMEDPDNDLSRYGTSP